MLQFLIFSYLLLLYVDPSKSLDSLKSLSRINYFKSIRINYNSMSNPIGTNDINSSYLTDKKKKDVGTTLLQILNLFKPYGDGQIKEKFHQINMKRSFTDIQIYTHICFIISIYISKQNQIYDLLVLLLIMTPLSLIYHFNYEKPGLIAKVEGFFAKLLFLYGFIQLFMAKSNLLLCIECILMISTIAVYVLTNVYKEFYEPYHCLMHIIPALWAGIVAQYHTRLIKLFI